ncbi:sulfotransferase [Mameliella alba]|uniref:sulfotransferase n=1 Tax=Mameliella alba TaxID=561184 RepID=UPI001431F499|nr:sulfotransferase [Mameliella alba]
MATELSRIRHYPELDGKTLLVCVGAMKCATSWLHAYMGGLEGVSPSPLKELHFFSRDFPEHALSDMDLLAVRRLTLFLSQEGRPAEHLAASPMLQAALDRVQMIYDDNAYFGHMARISTPQTRVICDVTPAYSVLGTAGFSHMQAFCATQDIRLKLLFVMRDPVERLWSQLRHMQQQGLTEDATQAWADALDAPAIMARGDYRATVTALDDCFAPEDLLYLFYEDLAGGDALPRLCRFLDTPWRSPGPGLRRNETTVGTALPHDAQKALAAALAPQYAFCRARFGGDLPKQWQG